ncbi:MAG: DUF501 domain-containing protein [Acidimicrobiia bacterium]
MTDSTDRERVTTLLGRAPRAEFAVVVRRPGGSEADPVVIRNAPFLDDGTPLPTRYWLVDPDLSRAVARLEAAGGVRTAQDAVDPDALAAAHERYATERAEDIPANHAGPRPFGGIGGTRVGVKCLHAHYAYWLAGGDDPVGAWVDARLHPGPSVVAGDAVRTPS